LERVLPLGKEQRSCQTNASCPQKNKWEEEHDDSPERMKGLLARADFKRLTEVPWVAWLSSSSWAETRGAPFIEFIAARVVATLFKRVHADPAIATNLETGVNALSKTRLPFDWTSSAWIVHIFVAKSIVFLGAWELWA